MVEEIINESSDEEDNSGVGNQNGQSSCKEVVDKKPLVANKPSKVAKRDRSASSESSDADNDAELAKKLQAEEESKNTRSTRSRGSSKANSSKKKTKKVAKKRKNSDDSSDEEPKKKKGGYMRSIPLSDALAEFTGEKEVSNCLPCTSFMHISISSLH